MANTPAPLQQAVDSLQNGKLVLSDVWTRWFNYLVSILPFIVNYAQIVKESPLTGFSSELLDSTQVLQLVPSATLATGTVTLPKNPLNGQIAEVFTTQEITTFTLLPNTGQTVQNAPSTLLAGTGISYYYYQADTTWYRTR